MNPNINMDFPRLESGFKIMDKVTKVSDMHYLVESSKDSNKYYTVDLRLNECNCPDFTYRNIKCKHLRAVEAKAEIYG